jgi:hypothetical protein
MLFEELILRILEYCQVDVSLFCVNKVFYRIYTSIIYSKDYSHDVFNMLIYEGNRTAIEKFKNKINMKNHYWIIENNHENFKYLLTSTERRLMKNKTIVWKGDMKTIDDYTTFFFDKIKIDNNELQFEFINEMIKYFTSIQDRFKLKKKYYNQERYYIIFEYSHYEIIHLVYNYDKYYLLLLLDHRFKNHICVKFDHINIYISCNKFKYNFDRIIFKSEKVYYELYKFYDKVNYILEHIQFLCNNINFNYNHSIDYNNEYYNE